MVSLSSLASEGLNNVEGVKESSEWLNNVEGVKESSEG